MLPSLARSPRTPALCLTAALVAAPAVAQLPGLPRPAAPAPSQPALAASPATTATAAAEPTAEAPDSPRASARAFADLTDSGSYEAAARHLAVPPAEQHRKAELARRLRAVIDHHLSIELDALSPLAEGDTKDGLPAGVDSLGVIPDGSGGNDRVFIVRTRDAAGALWAFSRQTVERVDAWYEALPDRWVRGFMPAPLQRYGPGRLMWWQWIALPLLLVVALVIGRLAGGLSGSVLQRIAARTPNQWDERLLARVTPALTLLWAAGIAAVLLPWLALLPTAHAYTVSLLGGLATVAVFWSLWRSLDVWAEFLLSRPWAADNPSARSLLQVTRNLLKVLVAVGGVVATLAAFGYPVATVLAGLGIGGLALAFGAQKTIENLFGSVALAADQPFRVGDFVKIEDFTGNVERIGMRSTQIRTLDRTLISLPNGKLADMRVEDFASRDRIRLAATIGLVYGTTEAQVRRVVDGIETLLRELPKIWPDTVVVRFAALGPSSLDINVMCWFMTADFNEFQALRQEALLGIMRVVEQAGTSFAFPTQTVHLPGLASLARPPARPEGPAPAQRAE
jgi:MscS family membrane protein